MRTILTQMLCATILLTAGCSWFEAKQAPATAQPSPNAPAGALPGEPKIPEYVCHKITAPITIDGLLNEAAWKRAATTGRFTSWSDKFIPRYETQARVLWDDQNLYIGFECEDGDIEATMKERDANLWEEHEICEVFIDPGNTQRTYYEFGFTPQGAVDDLIIPNFGAPRSLAGEKCWDCKGMLSAVKVNGTLNDPKDTDRGWTVEAALPLVNFSGAPHLPPKPGDTWRINFYRWENSFGKVELQAWSPTLGPGPNPHVPRRFGILRFAE